MVCEFDAARQEQAKQDYPDIQVIATVEDLVAEPDIDLVTMFTPHDMHAALAMQVLGGGKNY